MIALLFLLTVWDHAYECDITFAYDNNIFTYSREYIDDFMNHVQPYRFPFETYDDLYTESDLDLRLRLKLFGNHTMTFNSGIRIRHYAINRQKDFQRLTVGVRQSFNSWAVKGSYHIVPGYLIRYYRDPLGTVTDYIPCKVAYHIFTGKITLPMITVVSPAVIYRYSIDDYVEAFEIYDARAHTMGVKTMITLTKALMVDVSYDFKTSSLDRLVNIDGGTDEPIPDGAYYQQKVAADIQIRGIAHLPVFLSLGYTYSFRNHRSEQPDDRMHYGRQDHNHTISIETRIKIRAGLMFSVTYMHSVRETTSQVFPAIDMIKNYSKDRIGTGLHLYF